METFGSSYVGRFAPTPSGPLHFGSIIAALASFLDARSNQGSWLLRIDDLDKPRVKPGSVDKILSTLELLSLEWDGSVRYQSQRIAYYMEALDTLQDTGMVYRCYCPRKITRDRPYPGTCRDLTPQPQRAYALRLKTLDETVTIEDQIAGSYQQNICQDSGDFILLRSDNIISYNLAAAVDDEGGEITHVIRGGDLLESTPKQQYIQTLLGLKTPLYGHVPVATDHNGKKISKSDGATDIKLEKHPAVILLDALQFLGQDIDHALQKSDCKTVIEWAIEHWDKSLIPKTTLPTTD